MPPKLGIIAGGGLLPEILVHRCRAADRPVVVAALKGQGDPTRFAGNDVTSFRLGAVGGIIKYLKNNDIKGFDRKIGLRITHHNQIEGILKRNSIHTNTKKRKMMNINN